MVVQLTAFFEDSTPLLLAYAVPLLLLSILLTFSGTFLTLDRTRTFARRSDVTQTLPGAFERHSSAKKDLSFRLDGGLGGMAIGYAFGLHASTFLSLLITNKSSARQLSPTSFFVIWLLTILPSMALGGRWKIVALTFLGLSGGIAMSLALSVIIHPSLTSRVILVSIVASLLTFAVVLPSIIPGLNRSNLIHSNARIASSCLGAFSVTMAIALLTRSPSSSSWANVWDRLWVANGAEWGTSRERGFDVLFCVLWAAGALSDWALKRWIGEDPEEKWDAYLAEYSASLPNAHDRAGRFVPLQSWWTRLLCTLHLTSASTAHPHKIIFPDDKDFSNKTIYAPVPNISDNTKSTAHLSKEDLQRSVSPGAYNWEPSIPAESAGVLRKGKTRHSGGFKWTSQSDASEANAKRILFDPGHRPTFLQKAKSARTKHQWHRLTEKRRRAPVEFRPKEGFSSESDSEESSDADKLKTPLGTPQKDAHTRSPPLVRVNSGTTTLSGTTVHPSSNAGSGNDGLKTEEGLDVNAEKARLMNMKSAFGGMPRPPTSVRGAPEYSDVEEDVTIAYERATDKSKFDDAGWKPNFLKHPLSSRSSKPGDERVKNSLSPPSPGAVPKTPSLVYAFGRIAKAQADAYGPSPDIDVPPVSPALRDPPEGQLKHVAIAMDQHAPISGLPVITDDKQPTGEKKVKWDTFWEEIRSKATEA